eukprot:scaffold3810_cov120-Isochrysis_galbana.AAC.9
MDVGRAGAGAGATGASQSWSLVLVRGCWSTGKKCHHGAGPLGMPFPCVCTGTLSQTFPPDLLSRSQACSGGHLNEHPSRGRPRLYVVRWLGGGRVSCCRAAAVSKAGRRAPSWLKPDTMSTSTWSVSL